MKYIFKTEFMNNQENLGKRISIYKIACNVDGTNVITYACNDEINKVLYNKKHSKKDNLIKSILLKKDFTLQKLKTFTPKSKDELNDELIFWKNHNDRILKSIVEKKIQEEKQRLHNETYNANVLQGKDGEEKIKHVLEKCFNDVLEATKYRYNKVDFIGNNFLYEVKTFKGNFNDKYPTVIIGTNKAICENLIFIFQFGNEDIYFIRVNFELFKTFNTTHLKNHNRLYYNEVYLIPNNKLTKLDVNKTYSFELIESDFEKDVKNQIAKYENTKI